MAKKVSLEKDLAQEILEYFQEEFVSIFECSTLWNDKTHEYDEKTLDDESKDHLAYVLSVILSLEAAIRAPEPAPQAKSFQEAYREFREAFSENKEN